MPKWCLLQDEKIIPEYKSLVFNNLRNVLIFRVFASEGESVRKYSLNFWGRTENSDGKIKIRLQFESRPFCFIQAEKTAPIRNRMRILFPQPIAAGLLPSRFLPHLHDIPVSQ